MIRLEFGSTSEREVLLVASLYSPLSAGDLFTGGDSTRFRFELITALAKVPLAELDMVESEMIVLKIVTSKN